MLPFGPRLNTVFASRWKALLWALGVLFSAYCFIPSAPDGAPASAPPASGHPSPWSP